MFFPILDLANKVARDFKGKLDEATSTAGQLLRDAASHPEGSSFKGAPGRHHDNQTFIFGGDANYHGEEREVHLSCRIVGGGFGGGGFGEDYKFVTDTVAPIPVKLLSQYVPNPTYHWCITVGDYLHQLQATSLNGGWNYYTNERINRGGDGWNFYPVGRTRLNDVAIRDVATQVMNDMPEVYHILNNNCQNFSLLLADRILTTTRKQRFAMANGTYGIQKQPQMDIKMLNRTTITRIDTGEVVDPVTLEPITNQAAAKTEVAKAEVEEVTVPAAVLVADKEAPVHGEAVVVVGEQGDDVPRVDILRGLAAIMIKETPNLTAQDVEDATKATNTPAAPVAAA